MSLDTITEAVIRFFSTTETWRLILDKVLLAAVGFYFARLLERYRRKQVVVGELAKARAQAVVQVFARIAECDMAAHRLIEARADPKSSPERVNKLADMMEGSNARLSDEIAKNFFLMGSEMTKLVDLYCKLVGSLHVYAGQKAPVPEEVQETFHSVRRSLERLLPTLQLTDEHSDYLPPGWWTPRYWGARLRRKQLQEPGK
ncbi:MAG TPA: hypothetical protein VK539_02360 [Myxococcaceae bacterium]|nr:hypothetical protein [Myxococcaceae bacterium]